jgi:cyanophycin synthetase
LRVAAWCEPGWGTRFIDVAAVLNVQSDHLGLRGIDTLEQLAAVKRIPVEVAKDTAVLNADDPHVLRMADYTEAKHVCYVTMNPDHTLVREHIRAGGRAVSLERGINGQMITIYDHGAHIPLLWTHLIPATLEGRASHNVQNAMFAAALAFSMGVKLEDIRHGLRTFDTTFFQAPGRMNVFDELPFKVIVDYGHNAAAIEAMCQLVERLEPKGPEARGAGGPRGSPGRGYQADREGGRRAGSTGTSCGGMTNSGDGRRRKFPTCCVIPSSRAGSHPTGSR